MNTQPTTTQLASIELTDLQRAVIEQLGYNELNEECFQELDNVTRASEGAAAGFNGFIYYADTNEFAKKNIDLIFDLIGQHNDEGLEPLRRFPYEDGLTSLNWLAWYALESTAWDIVRQVEDMQDEDTDEDEEEQD